MGKDKLQMSTGATIKKYSKRIGLVIFVVFLICFVNGCYYLAKGQYTTVDKIAQGRSISLYEKTTIYTLHMGLYMFGWMYAPQAAWANMHMALLHRSDTIYYKSDCIMTPQITERVRTKRWGKVAWNGNVAYASNSPERNAAILLNGGKLGTEMVDGVECVSVTCPYTWKGVVSRTTFRVTSSFAITIHEQLFFELEKCGWLHPYTLVCYTEISNFNK